MAHSSTAHSAPAANPSEFVQAEQALNHLGQHYSGGQCHVTIAIHGQPIHFLAGDPGAVDDVSPSDKILSTVTQASDSDGLQMLSEGVNTLGQGLPALVRALDVIAKIHPIIEGASVVEKRERYFMLTENIRLVVVGAFKVIVELEIKRRDNDKKVKLIFLEMKNMMSTLLECVSSRSFYANTLTCVNDICPG